MVRLYQGLVPKLIARHADELAMLADTGITEAVAPTILAVIGTAEVGMAEVCEWYNEDEKRFQIQVEATNRTWGHLFGYRGLFDVTWQKVEQDEIPNHDNPFREERRE